MIPKLHAYFLIETLKGLLTAVLLVGLLIGVGMAFTFWQRGLERHMLELLFYSVPQILVFALPLAFFAGILLAIGRCASDSEISLMRACGLGLSHVYVPLGLVAATLSACSIVMWDRVVPACEQRMAGLVRAAAFDALREFSGEDTRRLPLPDMSITLYSLKNGSRPVAIVSQGDNAGKFISAEDSSIAIDKAGLFADISLKKGYITERGKSQLRTEFAELTFRIPGPGARNASKYASRTQLGFRGLAEESARMRTDSVTASEQERIRLERDSRRYEAQLHYEIATALSPLFLFLVAIPLAVLLSVGNRIMSVGAALLYVFVIYYPLLMTGQFAAERGSGPALLLLQLPNIAGLLIAIPLGFITRR
ncbi:MAG: LptF/LptG family permease [Candidatus Brocadiia bacterium]